MLTVRDDMDRKLLRKRRTVKQRVIDGFYAYLVTGSETKLMEGVYALAAASLNKVDNKFGEFAALEISDDFVQNVAIAIWNDFATFEGDGEEFYHRASAIIFNYRTKANQRRYEEVSTHVPFFVEQEDEDGEMEEVENPELHRAASGYHAQENPIPESVQGIDREICEEVFYNGRTYAQIADMFGMTENAIEHRVRKMRHRIEEARALERASKERQRSERDNEYNRQLMSRQRSRVRMDAHASLPSPEGR